MRTEYLEYFIDAAELESITLAARKNFISPQGLGRAIAVLEEEFGFELFNRNANSVALTHKGKEILLSVKQAMDAFDAVKIKAAEILTEKRTPSITLYCCTFVFISRMIDKLRETMVDIDDDVQYVQMQTSDILQTFPALQARDENTGRSLGIISFFSSMAEENHARLHELESLGVSYLPYLKYSDYALISRKHILANNTTLSKIEILSCPIISSVAEQRAALLKLFGPAAVNTFVEDIDFRTQLVRDGKGAILVPPFMEVPNIDELRFIELEAPYHIEVGFIGKRELLESKLLDRLLEGLNECYVDFAQKGLCQLTNNGKRLRPACRA